MIKCQQKFTCINYVFAYHTQLVMHVMFFLGYYTVINIHDKIATGAKCHEFSDNQGLDNLGCTVLRKAGSCYFLAHDRILHTSG